MAIKVVTEKLVNRVVVNKKMVSGLLLFLVMVVVSFIFLLPITVCVTTSLKVPEELTKAAFTWLPKVPQFKNYVIAFQGDNWGRYFYNSFLITIITVIGSLVLNSLAGYSLSRLKLKGSNLIFFFLLVGMMIPPQSYIIPQFIIIRSIPLAGGNDIWGNGGIGWLNTYWALIIPFLTGSFGIFLCRQFYLGFPKALDDAATIDGCSKFMTYIYIYLPLSKPILSTLAILKTVHTWNNFFYPLIMTNSPEMATVQIGLQSFRKEQGVEWQYLMAATIITSLPVLILFFGLQKYFIKGIVSSGVKG